MDERSVLNLQLENLRQELGFTQTSFLDFAQDEGRVNKSRFDVELLARVTSRLIPLFEQQRQALETIKNDNSEGKPLNDCWNQFQRVKRDCAALFQECLELTHGALGRAAGLDQGVCAIADSLLKHLGDLADLKWDRFTILDAGESFCDTAQVIRVRYPGTNIWNLAIIGHEFGHFIARELKVKRADESYYYPLREFVEKEASVQPRERQLLWERIADLFATYSLGPSFAFTAILLRFDPPTASVSRADHPSDAERAYLVLRTLENMGEYGEVVDELRKTWHASLKSAGCPVALDSVVKANLDRRIKGIYEWVDRQLVNVRYRGWNRARAVVDEMGRQEGDRLELPAGTELADVLNGAWLCRVSEKACTNSRVTQIALRALDACKQIIRRN